MSSARGNRGNQFKNSSWLALAPFAAVAFGLAYWGFGQRCTGHPCTYPSMVEQVGHSINLVRGRGSFSFGTDPWQLVLAQWLVPIAAILAAAKLFLLSLRRDLKVAFARRSRDHVIVCGLGDTGRSIAEQLREAGERVVAIDLDASSVNALAVEDAGAPTIQGDAKSAATLRVAGFRRAKALMVATGNDTTNLEIALAAAERAPLAWAGSQKLVIVPEMRTDWLFERFLSQNTKGLSSATVDFRLFNWSEMAARLMYRRGAFVGPAPAGGRRIDIVVIGFGDLGRAIVAQGLHTVFALPGNRLRVSIYDTNPEAAYAKFRLLYPGVESLVDIETTKARLTGKAPENCELLASALSERRPAAVFVCMPEDEESLFVATQTRAMLDRQGQLAVPVFTRISERRKLADLLAQCHNTPLLPDRLVPFGDCIDLLISGIVTDVEVDRLARACHEAYLESVADEPRESASRQPWPVLPELFRRSTQLFADHLEIKLRAAGLRSTPAAAPRPIAFTNAECDWMSEAEHWRWCVERRMAGWRYGPVRNDLSLQHPALLNWSAVPPPVQAQVRTVVSRIPAILARVGREIRREKVVLCDPLGPEAAARALDAFDPDGGEHLVLVVDLGQAPQRALALRAACVPHVSLRLAESAATSSATVQAFSAEEILRLRERIDGCVGEIEDLQTPARSEEIERAREPSSLLAAS